VSNGQEALREAKKTKPDLIISDVMMPFVRFHLNTHLEELAYIFIYQSPKIDGFRLIELLKEDPVLHSIPVILLSARAGEEAKVEVFSLGAIKRFGNSESVALTQGLRAGADDYLVKPFSARELLARVHTHLINGQMRDELENKVKQRTHQLERINSNLQSEIEQRQDMARVSH